MSHEFYIKRCLQIAKNGIGTTRPNPMVGCVIVYQDRIIGEKVNNLMTITQDKEAIR